MTKAVSLFVVLLSLFVAVSAYKNDCGAYRAICHDRCYPIGEECRLQKDGKCLQCTHWPLVDGSCQYNCSDTSKFGENCLYCTNEVCLQCFGYNSYVKDNKTCEVCSSIYRNYRCYNECSEIKRQVDCNSGCFWNTENGICGKCVEPQHFSGNERACLDCGYFYNNDGKCLNSCGSPATHNISEPACKACGYIFFHNDSQAIPGVSSNICLSNQTTDGKCSCSSDYASFYDPTCCTQCEMGNNPQYDHSILKPHCGRLCSEYEHFTLKSECDDCGYWGVGWYEGKCIKCTDLDKNAVTCGINSRINSCKEGYQAVGGGHTYSCVKIVNNPLEHCAFGVDTFCLKCMEGFTLKQSGMCHSCS